MGASIKRLPLTQLLQQEGVLTCGVLAPSLCCQRCCVWIRDQPVGLLLVVEAGFNSARALEDTRLLISQMSSVQAVGSCSLEIRFLRSSVRLKPTNTTDGVPSVSVLEEEGFSEVWGHAYQQRPAGLRSINSSSRAKCSLLPTSHSPRFRRISGGCLRFSG